MHNVLLFYSLLHNVIFFDCYVFVGWSKNRYSAEENALDKDNQYLVAKNGEQTAFKVNVQFVGVSKLLAKLGKVPIVPLCAVLVRHLHFCTSWMS